MWTAPNRICNLPLTLSDAESDKTEYVKNYPQNIKKIGLSHNTTAFYTTLLSANVGENPIFVLRKVMGSMEYFCVVPSISVSFVAAYFVVERSWHKKKWGTQVLYFVRKLRVSQWIVEYRWKISERLFCSTYCIFLAWTAWQWGPCRGLFQTSQCPT